jgi:hypothetical protein
MSMPTWVCLTCGRPADDPETERHEHGYLPEQRCDGRILEAEFSKAYARARAVRDELSPLKFRETRQLEPALVYLRSLHLNSELNASAKVGEQNLIKAGALALQKEPNLAGDIRIDGPVMTITSHGAAAVDSALEEDLIALGKQKAEIRRRLEPLEEAAKNAEAAWHRLQGKRREILKRNKETEALRVTGGIIEHTPRDFSWPNSFPFNDEVLPPFMSYAIRGAIDTPIDETCSLCGTPVRVVDDLHLGVKHLETTDCENEGKTLTNGDKAFIARGYCVSDERVRAWLSERWLYY